jgi:phage terminase large subunit
MLGLEPWFLIEKQGIKCHLTGSEFLFKGLRHDVQGIRSLEGVTRVWLEEGQWATSDSWLILDPTIRNKGSQIWVSYNPVNEDDPTHQMFAVNPPPDAYVAKVGWRDNPWFQETDLDRLRLRMLEQDRDAYDWVWEGLTRKVSDSTIFRNNYVVEGFDLPEKVDRFFYGVDWGFANDPLAAIRAYITGNEKDGHELWIDYEFFSVGIELDDIPVVLKGGRSDRTGAVYEGIPGISDWPVKADPSRPETISYVRRHGGLAITGAETWKGSVDDGIAHLKAFKKIHIHTRCENMAQEARLYSFKIDPKTKDQDKPVVLPIPEDKFNHGWDAVRYSLDGYIQHRGGAGVWQRLAR